MDRLYVRCFSTVTHVCRRITLVSARSPFHQGGSAFSPSPNLIAHARLAIRKDGCAHVAALPPQVIPQAGVGVGFIVHIVIAKYLDHLPLHRQERIDARAGVWVGRQARCRYVESVAHLLITIHQQLKSRILGINYIHVDETFTKLLDPDRQGGLALGRDLQCHRYVPTTRRQP